MDTHTKQLMFSSKESNWETPQDFFDKLHENYNFDLDPYSKELIDEARIFLNKIDEEYME